MQEKQSMETQELYEASAQRRCRTDASAHKTTIESPVAANVVLQILHFAYGSVYGDKESASFRMTL